MIAAIIKRYGFNNPLHQRYIAMLWNYLHFEFGDSLLRGALVKQLFGQSLPRAVTLAMKQAYHLSGVDPPGIRKAVYNGSPFDTWSSTLIILD